MRLEMRRNRNQQRGDLEVVMMMMGCCEHSERFEGFNGEREIKLIV